MTKIKNIEKAEVQNKNITAKKVRFFEKVTVRVVPKYLPRYEDPESYVNRHEIANAKNKTKGKS